MGGEIYVYSFYKNFVIIKILRMKRASILSTIEKKDSV